MGSMSGVLVIGGTYLTKKKGKSWAFTTGFRIWHFQTEAWKSGKRHENEMIGGRGGGVKETVNKTYLTARMSPRHDLEMKISWSMDQNLTPSFGKSQIGNQPLI